MNRILILSCFLTMGITSLAQESRAKFIGIELGGAIIGGNLEHEISVRPEGYYYGDYNSLTAFTDRSHFGITGELRSLNNKFGLSAGLRYSQINCAMGRGWFSSDNFYVLVDDSDNTLEYANVKEIKEESSYLGVPVSLSWYPFRERVFTFYVKGGFELTQRLNSRTTVKFVDPEMEVYEDKITDQLGSSRSFIAMFNQVAGLQIGRSSRFVFRFETGPFLFLNNRTSSITNAIGGFGGQFSFHIAL